MQQYYLVTYYISSLFLGYLILGRTSIIGALNFFFFQFLCTETGIFSRISFDDSDSVTC